MPLHAGPFSRRGLVRAGLLAMPALGLASAASAQSGAGGQAGGGQAGGEPPKVAPPDVPDRLVGRPAPKLEKEPPLPPERRVSWAVVGLGKFALGQIMPAFQEARASKPTALVSGDLNKARQVADRHGIAPDAIYTYETFDRIADDPRIQVVYVITPNSLHSDLTVRALRAGKHVLCEKPMAASVRECEAMIRAASDARRKLMIAYREQYEPHNLEAVRRLRAGEIGDVRLVVTDNGRHADPSDPADQWRLDRELAGGGSLPDVGIYGLNGARYLTGEEPAEVRAWIHNPPGDPRFREVEDVVAWQMRFPSGAIANSSTSYSYQQTSRFHVQGTKGELTLDPATEYDRHRLTVRTQQGEEEVQISEINQMAAEMDHLSEAIMNDTEVRSPGEEGLQDMRLIQALYEAARTGRAVKTDFGYRRRQALV